MNKIIFFLIIAITSPSSFADTSSEKESLAYLLEEIKNLDMRIEHAERQSSQNVTGTSFNYRALKSDMTFIKRGLEDYINDRHHLPRSFEPIQGEYRR